MSLRIKAIIALMGVALLGLIFIQFYWIDNALDVKEAEFNQKVYIVMHNVVNDLERKEALEKFRQHQLGKQMIHHHMMKRKHELIRKKRKLMKNISNSASLRLPHKNPNKNYITITDYNTPDSSTRIFRKEIISGNFRGSQVHIDIKEGGSSFVMIDNEEIPYEFDSLIDMKIDQKTAVIDEILFDLSEIDKPMKIEDRLSKSALDSMIKLRLDEVMINTKMDFGVFDYFGNSVESIGGEGKKDLLKQSVYKARLFPNDFFGEQFFLSLNFPNRNQYLWKSMWFTLSISTLFLLLIIGTFTYTINVIQNQKQLSMIKSDFINNMTHELKTPISTISLACEALNDEQVSSDVARKSKFLNMIAQENKRLAGLVDNVLKSSIWDKSDFRMKFEEMDMHDIIKDAVDSMEIKIIQKEGEIHQNLKAVSSTIEGDVVHLSNILNNLLDNAIKYSTDPPQITICTSIKDDMLALEVADRGVGISKDHQKKIFDKFYRIPMGNVHNVKGFGLGLNYAFNVIKNHNGLIEVKSSLGKGSTFIIKLPLKSSV